MADVLNRAPAGEKPIDARPKLFPELPGAKKELTEIAAVFEKAFQRKTEPGLRRQAATEQHLRSQATGKEFIHLATHGFFAPSSLRSALRPGDDLDAPVSLANTRFAASRRLTWTHPGLLSGIALTGANRGLTQDRQEGELLDDGILTAAELAEINLTGTRLVVLSACETGLGDTAGGEGLLGLQRALHVAGARSAITSLWAVPDHATQALMVEFYVNLWERKMDPLMAFRASQQTIMLHYDPVKRSINRANSSAKRLPPSYWAGFILSGDWR